MLDPATKRKLDLEDRAGICTNKIDNSLAVEAGGYENLTFGEREYRNYIASSRRLRLGIGGAALNYLMHRRFILFLCKFGFHFL